MATKKDLVEAQSFSKRRLTTAFVSGAPGGREVEPDRPLRAVVGGLALTVVLVLGSLAFGWLRSSLPDDWKNDRLVIAEDSGARYVSVKGVLHPVVNTTSARLLIQADRFKVLAVPDEELADIKRGPTLGILGAPDSLTPRDRLVNSGWISCLGAGQQVSTVIGANAAARAAESAAVLVRSGDKVFVVGNGMRYPVAPRDLSAVSVALRLDGRPALAAPAAWLNLFPRAAPWRRSRSATSASPCPVCPPAPRWARCCGSRPTGGTTSSPPAAPSSRCPTSPSRCTGSGPAPRPRTYRSRPRSSPGSASSSPAPPRRLARRPAHGPRDDALRHADGRRRHAAGRLARHGVEGPARGPARPHHRRHGQRRPRAGGVGHGARQGPGARRRPDRHRLRHRRGRHRGAGPARLPTRRRRARARRLDRDVPLRTGARHGGGPHRRLRHVMSRPRWAAALAVPVLAATVLTVPAGPAVAVPAAAPPVGLRAAGEPCEEGRTQWVTDTPPALNRFAAQRAWTLARGAGVTVAVVDSGIARNKHFPAAASSTAAASSAGRPAPTGGCTERRWPASSRRAAWHPRPGSRAWPRGRASCPSRWWPTSRPRRRARTPTPAPWPRASAGRPTRGRRSSTCR
ncbi:hypothetical protein G7075_09275 [Phycicoccus sp. HDW14]|nr:hypothetical protein G7075_09275 [Phycicoccus sp. HDW14]